jgi:uncharacterized membrane protein YfcA
MLSSIPVSVLIGALLGFLAGLGIGGGSLLMLWLTILLKMPYPTARAVNLLFFLAAAGGVSVFRLKKGKLDLPSILPGILSGCLLAAVGAWMAKQLDLKWIQKCFGILLLVTGFRELFYRPRNAR